MIAFSLSFGYFRSFYYPISELRYADKRIVNQYNESLKTNNF